MYNPEMKEAVRAILLNDEGKVLVGKRARGIGVGQWALIGGKPDADETKEKAVVRETKEETNLNFIKPTYFTEEENELLWHTTYYYGGTTGEIKLKEDEISEVRYVGRTDLDELDFAFGHEKILKQFFAR